MLRRVAWQAAPDVLKDRSAFTFRAKYSRNFPEDLNRQRHHCENLKTHHVHYLLCYSFSYSALQELITFLKAEVMLTRSKQPVIGPGPKPVEFIFSLFMLILVLYLSSPSLSSM
jgi:hypothetical protein